MARYGIIAISGLVGFVLLFFLSTELTSRPAFCATCHNMKPYIEGWKASTHSDVTCTDCHFPPGFKNKIKGKITAASMVVNYMTGIYKKSKPWAEIEDESCLRPGCHVERLLEGPVLFQGKVKFDHKPHLTNLRRGKELRCTSCHSQIVQGEHISVTETTCFLCHFKNQTIESPVDDCTWCHQPPVESEETPDISYDHSFVNENQISCKKCHGSMQVGDGAVLIERCSSCHAEVDKLDKFNDDEFMHKNHVTDHKVECIQCHSLIQHKSVSRSQDIMPDCYTCHQNTHNAQLGLFSGIGGKDLPHNPNPMFTSGLNCQGCHVVHTVKEGHAELGGTLTSNSEACDNCHGEGYNRLLGQWSNLMEAKMLLVEETLEEARKAIKSVKDPGTRGKLQEKFVHATYNFDLVKKGNIIHNIMYSDQLLKSSYNAIIRLLNELGIKKDRADYHIYNNTSVPSECKNCHYGIEETEVAVFGISFKHDDHVAKQNLDCSTCHSHEVKHGALVRTREACLSCHHTQEDVACEHCHSTQSSLYEGNTGLYDGEEPDIMYDAEVYCSGCHMDDDEKVSKANEDNCIACHDDDYGPILEEWQTDAKSKIVEVEGIISKVKDFDLNRAEMDDLANIMNGVDFLKKDKGLGVHNFDLIVSILEDYKSRLNSLSK